MRAGARASEYYRINPLRGALNYFGGLHMSWVSRVQMPAGLGYGLRSALSGHLIATALLGTIQRLIRAADKTIRVIIRA